MKVLICGGRDLDPEKVREWLVGNAGEMLWYSRPFVIEGGATGADEGARLWAKERHCPGQTYFADWGRYGASAGPIRNARMLKEGKPDVVLAFPGGVGTANMEIAGAAGVRIIEAAGDFTFVDPAAPPRYPLVPVKADR